jgi:hypothetical protein
LGYLSKHPDAANDSSFFSDTLPTYVSRATTFLALVVLTTVVGAFYLANRLGDVAPHAAGAQRPSIQVCLSPYWTAMRRETPEIRKLCLR